MRVVRFLAYGLLLIFAAFVTALLVLIRNQDRITRYALDRIYQRTGMRITIADSKVGLGADLAVVMDSPRVAYNGAPIGTLRAIRLVLSYPALLFSGGLPLARLELDDPQLQLPENAQKVSTEGVPRLSPEMVESLRRNLEALADTARRVDVVNGAVAAQDNAQLISGFNLRARREHYHRPGKWPWILDFNATLEQASVRGAQLSGRLALQPQNTPAQPILAGHVRFWDVSAREVQLGVLSASADIDGQLSLAMDSSGSVSGGIHSDFHNLAILLEGATQPWRPADLEVASRWRLSSEEVELTDFTVRQATADVVKGVASLAHPFSVDSNARVSLGGARLELNRLYGLVGVLPASDKGAVAEYAKGIAGGDLLFSSIALQATTPIRDWSLATLRDQLQISAMLNGAAYQFPPAWRLPDLRHLDAALVYSSGILRVNQASFELGASRAQSVNAELNLRKAPANISYNLQLIGRLNLTDLYPPLVRMLPANWKVSSRVQRVGGNAALALTAADDIKSLSWKSPRSYRAKLTLDRVSAGLADLPQPVVLAQGGVLLTPRSIKLDHVRMLPDGDKGGDVIFNGAIEPNARALRFRRFTAEVHRVAVENWLPRVIDPDDLGAHGLIGGLLAVSGAAGAHSVPMVTGELTLGAGDLALGFLRSPIKLSAATLTLDGKGLVLNVPGGWLEGAPLNFRMAVADLRHPAVRIDARAGRLDLLVMRFIRLPWSPALPPRFFAVPVSGHLEADRAVFDKLVMSKVAADFSRDDVNWRVFDFTGQAFDGDIRLEIDGRTGPNNWIRMVGTASELDSAALLRMANPLAPRALTGRLSVPFDLWANTDTNFFQTLAGTFSLHAHDGVLERFALLSRILSLINLKNWITAQFPDPRVGGIPYKTIDGDFKGVRGDFYTDNLRLSGPLMDISARGHIEFGQSRMDMEVGMVPFSTVNWIVSHIPIVGANLAGGTRGLVGAYFHVYGATSNPTIIPKPITSIAEFVKRTLGLPVNIIAPRTIK